jgi:hypothetical protein
MIQEEIDGHPPIPLAQNRGFHLGSFSTSFQVLNFWGHFEALNNVFLGPAQFNYRIYPKCYRKMCIPRIYISNELSRASNIDCMQNLHPWEVDIPTTPIGDCKPFGVSSSRIRVLGLSLC